MDELADKYGKSSTQSDRLDIKIYGISESFIEGAVFEIEPNCPKSFDNKENCLTCTVKNSPKIQLMIEKGYWQTLDKLYKVELIDGNIGKKSRKKDENIPKKCKKQYVTSDNFDQEIIHSTCKEKKAKLKNADLSLTVFNEKKSKTTNNKAPESLLKFENIPKDTDEFFFQLSLEKKMDAASFQIIKMNTEKRYAIVCFKNEKEARNWIKSREIDCDGDVLLISEHKKDDNDNVDDDEDDDDWDNDGLNDENKESKNLKTIEKFPIENVFDNSARTVEIHGNLSGLNKECLLLYAENKNRSGGGDVEDIQFEDGQILIHFTSSLDAKTFLEKKHELSNSKFTATLLDFWPIANGSCAIKIHVKGGHISEEDIQLVLENKRYGGSDGSIEEYFIEDDNTFIIVFNDASVVKNIMGKNNVINYSDKILNLNVLEPAKPPPIISNEKIDDKKLLFTYLTPKCLENVATLKEFIEKISKVTVDYFVFSPKPDKVLTQFEKSPDYSNILKSLCTKPFCGRMISVQKVAQTKCIQMSFKHPMVNDYLILYLENKKRSGGGPILDIKPVEDEDGKDNGNSRMFIIEFEKFEDADNVCKRMHTFENNECFISPYYESMSLFPPGFDSTKPPPLLPGDVALSILKEVYGFLQKNDSIIKEIESKLNKYYCSIIWPESIEKCEVVLTWKNSASNQSYFDCDSVKQQAENEMKCFIEEFSFEKIPFNLELFERLEKKMNKISLPAKERMITSKLGKSKDFVVCCGYKTEVSQFVEDFKKLIKQINDEINDERQQITSAIQMRAINYKFLSKTSQLREISKKYEIALEKFDTKELLHFTCSKINEKKFKLEINDLIAKIENAPVSSFPMKPEEFNDFFSNENVINELEKTIQTSTKKFVLLEADDNELQGYSTDKEALEMTKKILSSLISKCEIDLDEHRKKFLKEQAWDIFLEDLKRGYGGALISSCTDSKLTFIGYSKNEENLKNLVEKFLKDHVSKTKFIPVSSEVIEVIDNFAKEEIIEINRKAGKDDVDVKVLRQTLAIAPGFQLMGREEKMNAVESDLKELCKKVVNIKRTVRGYAEKILNDEILLNGICHKHNVVIKNLGKSDVESTSAPFKSQDVIQKPKNKSQATASLPSNHLDAGNGIIVGVIKGSIVDQKTEALFDSCDYKLDLNKTAISKVLSEKAGPDMQKELKDVVGASNLTLGQVVRTQGFKLPCKFVYHGSCFQWNKNSSKSENGLKQLVSNALKMASDDKLKSISFPAIGTGKLNVPPVECARIMLDEVLQFATSTSTTLKEINIVVYEKDMDTMKEFLQKLSSLKKKNIESDVDVASYEVVNKPKNGNDDEDCVTSSDGKTSWKIKDLHFQIVEGDLIESQTDVIVNSTNEKLNVSVGAVSKAIMAKAGDGVIQECKDHGHLKNHMAVTSAGDLPHKHIIHVSAKTPDEWTHVISCMFDKAEELKMKSLAMPPLGTRKGAETHRDMVSAIVKAVQTFANKKPNYLKNISIFILDKDLLEVFSKEFNSGVLERLKNFAGNKWDYITNYFSDRHESKTTETFKMQPSHTHFIQLDIYSMSNKNIDYAVDEINKSIDGMLSSDSINLLFKLPKDELDKIRKDFKVNLLINEEKLTINGETDNVQKASNYIISLMRDKKDKEKNDNEIKIFSQYSKWTYSYDDPKLPKTNPIACIIVEYGRYSTGMLERAFQSNTKDKVVFDDKDKKKHSVDLQAMTDVIKDGSNKYTAKVKRIPQGNMKLPDSWEKMAPGETHKLFDLNPKSKEYSRVETNFKATAGNLIKTIIKIQRIQNPALYMQYKSKKLSMENNTTLYAGKTIEKRLWHGTSPDTLAKINSNNFNRSYGGKHGLSYGNGVYFAVNSQYSISGYSSADSLGNKYIYQARVLVGNATLGSSGLKEPPPLDITKGILHDSVVDNLNNPSMYVVFYDYQMYPEYMIMFQ